MSLTKSLEMHDLHLYVSVDPGRALRAGDIWD